MRIPGCGGAGKSQLIRALSKYFFITKRMQTMRKLAPTGIAAAEIDGMTMHSFLGEQRRSGKPRAIKPGDSKLEREWHHVEYLLIDEMSMVGLTLLAKLNRIICVAKHVDPQVPFGGVNVIFLVTICNIDQCMMRHCTLIFHYPSKRNRVNYLRKKKFNNVLRVPLFFKSTVSSSLLNRCERKTCSTCSCLNHFAAENATTGTTKYCKLE